ncbi:MAG: adenine phosphoribosyltransferase [Candidatus Firestonebacteria bacterium]|nr:adenine phosphoribosyltransferase [Candidatus Firestonebacteria bacterium]
MQDIQQFIRDIPDFPKPGIVFKDITPLLINGKAFHRAIDLMAEHYQGKKIDQVVCVEARGFILGAPLAYKLGAGIVPVRKPGKLPHETIQTTYELEYGTDTLEIHKDSIPAGGRVLVADDVLATGGTAEGVLKLVEQLRGEIVGVAFLIELGFLKGRDKLKGQDVFSLIKY